MAEKVGLIGLGAMGMPIAKRLLEAGYALTVVPHVRKEPADELARLGAARAERPRDLAGTCDIVITSVPDSPQVEDALFGEHGFASEGARGALHIDLSTIAPMRAVEFSERLAELDIEAVDAPVSGGPMRAADGTLTVMVGGNSTAYNRARPVIEAIGKHIVHVGRPGSGQVVKLANQLMISIIMLANAEALSMGVKAGVPLETLVDVIGTSSGSNYLMKEWLPKTYFSGNEARGFALDLLIKDVRAALESCRQLGIPAPTGALAEQLYTLARTRTDGRLDYSVVAKIYEEAAGVELRLDRHAP